MKRRSSFVPILLAGVALGARLAFTWLSGAYGAIINSDGERYARLALSLLAGDGFAWGPGEPTAHRLFGYPWLLAGVIAVCGPSMAAVQWVQAALGSAVVLPVVSLGRRLGGEWTGVLAGLAVALHPVLIYLASLAAPDGAALACEMGLVWCAWILCGGKAFHPRHAAAADSPRNASPLLAWAGFVASGTFGILLRPELLLVVWLLPLAAGVPQSSGLRHGDVAQSARLRMRPPAWGKPQSSGLRHGDVARSARLRMRPPAWGKPQSSGLRHGDVAQSARLRMRPPAWGKPQSSGLRHGDVAQSARLRMRPPAWGKPQSSGLRHGDVAQSARLRMRPPAWGKPQSSGLRHGRGLWAAAVVATALAVLPPVARNAAVFGEFIPLPTIGGATFWCGNNAGADGGCVNPSAETWPGANPPTMETRGWPGLTETESQARFYRAAFEWMRSDPAAALRLLPKKLARSWSLSYGDEARPNALPRRSDWLQEQDEQDGQDLDEITSILSILYSLLNAAFGLAALAGAVLAWRKCDRLLTALLLAPAAAWLVKTLVFYGSARQTAAVLPAAAIFAGAALAEAAGRVSGAMQAARRNSKA